MESSYTGVLGLLLVCVGVLVALAAVAFVVRSRAGRSAAPAEGVSDQTRAQAHALVTQGQPDKAVEQLQKLAGLSHGSAKAYVDSLIAAIDGAPVADSSTAAAGDLAEVRALLAQGNKIAAVKRYREQFDVGLKEAKDAVDALERGQQPAASLRQAPSGDLAEVRALLAQGNKIAAIKRYRELSGAGLKEAKDYVDELEARG